MAKARAARQNFLSILRSCVDSSEKKRVKSNFYLKCFLSLLSAFLIVWLASRRTFYNDTISSPFLSIALLSVLLILLRTTALILEDRSERFAANE